MEKDRHWKGLIILIIVLSLFMNKILDLVIYAKKNVVGLN